MSNEFKTDGGLHGDPPLPASTGYAMTFEQALEAQMKQLDDAYSVLRALHAEPRHLNDESTQMKESLTRFRNISTRIFRLKLAWDEANDLMA